MFDYCCLTFGLTFASLTSRTGASPIDVSAIVPAHLNVDNLHRELSYPIMPTSGIVDFVLPAGAAFKTGDLMANVTSQAICRCASDLQTFSDRCLW